MAKQQLAGFGSHPLVDVVALDRGLHGVSDLSPGEARVSAGGEHQRKDA